MAVLQKSVQTDLERIPTFQETYKLAYSHGLETIYSLEHVDIKSVRKLVQASKKVVEDTKEIQQEIVEDQLSFDLGPLFRGWMTPHILQEPIQVLGLSKHTEKFLLDREIYFLGALNEVNFTNNIFFKGLGHGNVEDVRNKLQNYLAEKPIHKSATIDFVSLLKCLCANLELKKVYALLEPWGLAEWLSLSTVEGIEFKKVKTDIRQNWAQEITQILLQGNKLKFLMKEMQLIIDTWIVPWLWRRGGFATAEQIYETLQLRSSAPDLAEKVINLLFKWVPLNTFLKRSEGIYAQSEADIASYKKLQDTALSYFVHPSTIYPVDELKILILKELALQWCHAPFLMQQLHLSAHFNFYRNEKGIWFVKPTSC